jgi:ribosome recycling factor
MGAPAIFGKQIEIKLFHPASTLESRIQVIKALARKADKPYKM